MYREQKADITFVVSVSLNATWRVDFPLRKIAFFGSLAYNLQSTLYSYRMLELRTLCSLWGVYTFKAHLHFNWFYRITPPFPYLRLGLYKQNGNKR